MDQKQNPYLAPAGIDEPQGWLSRLIGRFRPPQPPRCHFCWREYKEAKPFIEGITGALICGQCIEACRDLMLKELERLAAQANAPTSGQDK